MHRSLPARHSHRENANENAIATAKVTPPAPARGDQNGFRPGPLWRWTTGAAGLIICAVAVRYLAQHPTMIALLLSGPIVCLGVLMMSRAPRVRVRLAPTELQIVGLFASRCVPHDGIRSVQLSGGKATLLWETRRGRRRSTRLPGLGGGRSARGKSFLHALDLWLAR